MVMSRIPPNDATTNAVVKKEPSGDTCLVASSSTVPAEAYNQLKLKCESLEKQLRLAKRQGGEFRKRCDNYKARHERDKKAIKSWQEYHDRLCNKLTIAKDLAENINGFISEVGSGPCVAYSTPESEMKPANSPRETTSSSHNTPCHTGQEGSNLRTTSGPEKFSGIDATSETAQARPTSAERFLEPAAEQPRPSSASIVIQSSQTTEDEKDMPEANADSKRVHESDSDAGVIEVSTRQLKRKRREPDQTISSGDKIVKVKSEDGSSPISYAGIARLYQDESVDLDEITGNITTPRKKGHNVATLLERSSSVPLDLDPCATPKGLVGNLDSSRALTELNGKIDPGYFKSKSFQSSSGSGAGELYDESERKFHPGTEKNSVEARNSAALKSLDANKLVSTKESVSRRSFKSMDRLNGSRKESRAQTARFQATSKRLPSLRNSGIVESTDLIEQDPYTEPQAVTPKSSKGSFHQTRSDTRGGSKSSSYAMARPPFGDSDTARSGRSPALEASGREKLRLRPVQDLTLEDFKVNPKANQGYTYAFKEVVRNQDMRRCLPGCTRPECCGNQFEQMVKLGGSTGLWDSSQENGETSLLKEYMGDAQWRIEAMSAEERAEILVKAKTEKFAKQYGRHRQVFQRSKTPPGFWRTDMPSTQEAETDRAMSKMMERDRIQERYKEAMRANGQWMFRDE